MAVASLLSPYAALTQVIDLSEDKCARRPQYITTPDQTTCEFSLVVSDAHGGQGLGSRLMLSIMDVARGKGLAEIEGLVLPHNEGMLRLMRSLGFAVRPFPEDVDFKLCTKTLCARWVHSASPVECRSIDNCRGPSMFDDLDDGARVGVWAGLGVIALLLFGLLGGLAMRQMHHQPATVSAPAAPAEEALLDGPLSGDLVGTVYFALGQSVLPESTTAEVAKAKQALDAAPSAKIVLSGFHDASGDPVHNAELAKDRAKAVRGAFQAAGVDTARVALRKPESTTGDGSAQEARRVEIRIVP